MKIINHTAALFIIIILEGYIVLSSELLAIRLTIPYVGSGTDTISVIIAAVLMPLAFGYYAGGRFKRRHIITGKHYPVRQKLVFNILISATILLFGLSYSTLDLIFKNVLIPNFDNRIMQISVYCLIFVATPVYLMGQTVPLVSSYFRRERLQKITGKILFFSTLGSFAGAVLSTLGLMATIGVHHTVSLNFVLLAILVIILAKPKISFKVLYISLIALLAMALNSDAVMRSYGIRAMNQYNTLKTKTYSNGERHLFINNNYSSKYSDNGQKHSYINFAEKIALYPILDASPAKDILVIGAGGFTFGHNDMHNNYIYVDIDKDLQNVAEKHILKEPIGPNKKFVAQPIRGYLSGTEKLFDVIAVDTFAGGMSIPEQLVTREFYQQVKDHLKPQGVMVMNFVASPHFNNDFSRTADNTIRSVFPHVSRQVLGDFYSLWSDSENLTANVTYIYKHNEKSDERAIYTDDKNTMHMDKPHSIKP